MEGWRAESLEGWRKGELEGSRHQGIEGWRDYGRDKESKYLNSKPRVHLHRCVGFINTWLTHADEAGGVHSKLPIAPYSVQCTLYGAHCTVYSVQCTVKCTVHRQPPAPSVFPCVKAPHPRAGVESVNPVGRTGRIHGDFLQPGFGTNVTPVFGRNVT